MATALEVNKQPDLLKQVSQVSICTLDSTEEPSDIDSIVNKCWKFEEVEDLLQSQLAILPGGRDKNGGAIIIMQGTEGQMYLVAYVGKVLSYLSKIPNDQIQGQGFTIILDMRQATWSQMKKALESLRLTFVEHIYHVIIMKPKSLWQRGRTTMNFNIKKNKYKFKCTLLEHSSDIFQHISVAHVPKAQNGQLEYDHNHWMEIQKTIESFMLQLLSKRRSYLSLQDILEKPENPVNLEEARQIVKYHISLQEQLDKSGLDNLCATVSHTIARLRPSTSNPDFESSFIHLEEICGSLQATLIELETLWETKGDKLDRVLQFRTFENDAAQHILWLHDQVKCLSYELTKVGNSVSLAVAAKEQVEEFRRSINSKHSEINRVIEVGQRLVSLDHPSKEMINQQIDEISEKWEGLTDTIEERMSMVILSVNFHTKEDKFVQHCEGWNDECSSNYCPPDITTTEEALEKHKKLREFYSDLYTNARHDGHALIEKLRRPVGEGSVPPDFILAVRHIKEVLENLYDEKNLVDEQWQVRQDHLKKTYNFRVFQRDTQKIVHWISEIGNPFLTNSTSVGVDVNTANTLLRAHDSFESDSEIPVVYSQCNLLQSRAKELIATKECRKDEVEAEANKLEEVINNFASRLDDRRDVLVLAIECFKATDNFLGEASGLSVSIPQERFEGDHLELEERLARFRARHSILYKISSTTLKLWDSLKHRLKSSAALGESSGCPINFSSTVRTLEEKIKTVEKERDKLSQISQQREKRWELALERHNLVKDMEEYSVQLVSWLQGIDPKGELGDNISDAQLQLEIFERQYKQQNERQRNLILRGKEINGQIDHLDQEMFGSKCINTEIQKVVNNMVLKMEKERDRMIKEAEPHLNLLQECVQYYRLDQQYHNFNSTLNKISSSLSRLVGVGHNLNDAQTLDQSVKDIQDTLHETSQDVDTFVDSVASCVEKNCYQCTSLNILSRSLSEKLVLVKRNMCERQRVIKSALEFHSNYDKLQSTMEYCQSQFSSRECGKSLVDIDHQQESMKELKQSLIETVEVVKNQAEQLMSILSVPGNGGHTNHKVSSEDANEDNSGPRLLVAPKKVRSQDKDKQSSMTSSQPDQLVVEDLVNKMNAKVSRLNRLWDSRHMRLEQSKQIIEFEEEVPKVLKWLDEVGAVFLEHRHDYGRSLEEVEKLLQNYDVFQRDSMSPMVRKVDELKKMMNQFEESGHYELNRIRSIGSHLEQQWNRFESDVKTRLANLKLSLSFQENLFQGSNWCMQSEQFLHSLDEKINQCDTSDEAKNLAAELSVYLSVTKKEQSERVSKIQQISSFLHSNPLNELATQLEHSTNHMLKDFENVQQDLKMLHDKLVQIEKEKDREMRLLKQKERVIEELITTEEVYVNDLKLVVDTYKPRFISEFLPESLKGKETVVFGNIQWIAEFHIEVLWPQLQSIDVADADAIAEVFVKNADVMTDLYVPYCQNKTSSEDLLASHRSYLNRVSSLFGSDIPLSSLLIKPIQRITKYPLLLKDCLKYTKQLGQSTELLQLAVRCVEEIPVQTNNAIHLSLLKSEEGLKWHKYGDLLYQGSLLVSEPRLLITSEKERQVFAFENTVVFARRIEQGQAKFYYDYKFRIPLTAGVQVLEFIEGEPCKFALFTSDHRMHLKASSIDTKNDWVRALRTAIQKHIEDEKNKLRSLSVSGARIRSNAVASDVVAKDLSERHSKIHHSSRPSSPFSTTRINAPINESTSPPLVKFECYKVVSDYVPLENDQHGLSLKKNQTVEVMEQLETGRWFIRATTMTGQIEHGWVPSHILEQLPPDSEDTQDRTDDNNVRRRHTSAADSQQVISNLKRVTIGQASPSLQRRTLVVQPSPHLGMSTRKSPGRSPSPQPPLSPKKIDETSLDRKSPVIGRFKRKNVVRRKSSTKSNGSISESDQLSAEITRDSSSDDEREIENRSPLPSPLPPPSPLPENVVDIEEEKIKREKAEQKIRYILAELYETEMEYVSKLEKLVNGFLKSVQDNPNLPEPLQGKERTIFGNVAAIYEFHRDVFKELIEKAKDSQEAIAQCFLDKRTDFKLYVTYCEHKPKSESFVWTYTHQGGTFFAEVQKKLNLREDIASFLIKPVQRITKYQLLLKDLLKTSQKAGKDVPLLEEALQLMQDVPKQANDAMALSMIVGYHGNIHANGQIILQDEFVIYEKSRWTVGSHRHVFLLDLMMIITKEKDNDGLYVFKDALKVHNMTLTEKQADSPCRFAIGTGQIGDWDKYYIFEASSSEKKLEWVRTIKEILNQQFEMLKALKQPSARNRNSTVDNVVPPSSDSGPVKPTSLSNVLDDMSDSSLDDVSEEEGPTTPIRRNRASAVTSGDMEHSLIKQPLYAISPKLNLYIAGDDYPPPVQGQKIFHIRKGQIYNVINSTGDWWLARLVREVSPGDTSPGTEGWVPYTFMDVYHGVLTPEEKLYAADNNNIANVGKYSTLPARSSNPRSHTALPSPRLSLFPSFSVKFDDKKKPSKKKSNKGGVNVPQIITFLSDESILCGRDVQFKCRLAQEYPDQKVEWFHDGELIQNDRAFSSAGEHCILKINTVCPDDEGLYMCVIAAQGQSASTSGKLTVLGPPNPPGKPDIKQITSTSVSLTWSQPSFDGHSPITIYLIECKDILADRWCTLMKRVTEPATIVEDLVPGMEYSFRIIAGNHIGSSAPSEESIPIKMVHRSPLKPVFSLEPFDNHYTVMSQIAKGQFSTVHECLHEATQQTYVAKLLPIAVGHDHCHHELAMLVVVSHPNIVQMISAYLTERHYIFVMQYIHGVHMYDYFVQEKFTKELVIANCCQQLIYALDYLHNKNIAHLAIKPDNILIWDKQNDDLELKLIHFSNAKVIKEGTVAISSGQSLEYEAPEVLMKDSVCVATDMWSVGVLLYTLLAGMHPFFVDSLDLTKENIKKARFSLSSRQFKGVSSQAKNMISHLLQRLPSERLTSSQCLNHPWLTNENTTLNKNVIDMKRLQEHLQHKAKQLK